MTAEYVIAFLLGAVAVARATRLLVDDDFPPLVRIRAWGMMKLPYEWAIGLECAFCVSVWFAAANTLWAYTSDLHWTWWALNVILAGAYLAAIINKRDVPSELR